MVVLTEVTPELRQRVLRLAPLPEQVQYSGAARDTLPMAERNADRIPVTAIDPDGEPVAFLVLDVGPTMPAVHEPGVIGVRGFFVAAGHQGAGLGVAVLRALPAFVRERYPAAERIALTVNVRNERAVRAYLRAGFRDTGREYAGGRLGPQHVLELDL
jgi:RimJ/RimL family protein N-acetyltransferase